jgi:DNA-binding transcriptional ArsR family regulator
MTKNDVTTKDVYDKLEEIRNILTTQLTLFKIINSAEIENAKSKILEDPTRNKIFDLCDNTKNVSQIAQAVFPNKPLNKSKPATSYHLSILEEYDLVAHRDDKGQRYYFKKRE